MHRSIGAAAMALLVVTSVVTVGFAGAVAASSHSADAQIAEQTSGGHTVVVDEVTVPDGGFVTIHDSTVLDGGEAVIKSVRGSFTYLEAGTHEDVEVKLDQPLTEDDTLVAMPHRDTNGDRIYSFGSSGGADDGPYTADGEPVVDTAEVTVSASVGITEQPSDGSSVVVDRVELSEGGFVTIHDSTLQDGETFDGGARTSPLASTRTSASSSTSPSRRRTRSFRWRTGRRTTTRSTTSSRTRAPTTGRTSPTKVTRSSTTPR